MNGDSYTTLRHFADSWGLAFMVVSFLGLVAFALRPGAREWHRDAADSIFKDDDNG